MATTLRTGLLILLFSFIITMQFNLDADKTATRQIKNALELATHDAGLAIDVTSLSQGKVIFNQSLAIDQLQKSLETNLDIKSEAGYVYTPNSTSFYQKDLYIVHLEFRDDSNTIFPYTYSNPDYDILERLNGPSVIAVMTTDSPRWFKGGQTIIRQAAVYEYKK